MHISITAGLYLSLVKEGFTGKIFATPATKDLSAILMSDSAGIQENDVKFENKARAIQGRPYLLPLYAMEDAVKALEYFVPVDYGQWYTIDENIQFQYLDAGHIIGSTTVHFKINENGKETRLTFSGDVGRYRDVILKSPDDFPQADYIIIESTYGNKLHDEVTGTGDALLQWITKTCLQKKGQIDYTCF